MLQSMQQMREEMKAGQEGTAPKLVRNAKCDPFPFHSFRFYEDEEEQLQSALSRISRAEKGGSITRKEHSRTRRDVCRCLAFAEESGGPCVLRSRADSTTKKYLGAYQRWKTWAEARHEVPAFPVLAVHLALYLQHLSLCRAKLQ